MDQAIMQSFDLQLFADEAEATATEPQDTTETNETETQGAESDISDDTALDYSKLGRMSQDEQFAALKSAGVFGDGKPADKPQEPPQQAETTEQEETDGQAEKAPQTETEPEYEVTVDGEKVKVKQSELLSGYQRQADYTRKTQELAEQRRQVDAMMAALKVHQQTAPAPEQGKPDNAVKSEYEQAVAQAEKDLGLKAGEFNQFDPQHMFALQRVTSRVNAQQTVQQTAQAQVQQEINQFVAEAQKDPLTPKIDESFNQYAFRLAAESPDGANKCMAIMAARDRFLSNRATPADTKVLKDHWSYVKSQLSKPADPPVTPAPAEKPEPPKTETPGQTSAQHKAPVNFNKIKDKSMDDKFAALKAAGYF
jgi:HAMP domain-containing protein